MRLIGMMTRGCFLVGTLFCFDKLTLVNEVVKTMISNRLNRLVTSSMRSGAIRVGSLIAELQVIKIGELRIFT